MKASATLSSLIALVLATICVGCTKANFSGNPTSGPVPLSVAFADTSTGSPTAWEWDFNGDGTVDSTEQNPTYTYQSTGYYTVSLTVHADAGKDTITRATYIIARAGESEDPSAGEERTFAGIAFLWIPPGTFLMGSAKTPEQLSEEYGGAYVHLFNSEQPQHRVAISTGFWMGKYEVTQSQWIAIIGSNPAFYQGDNKPGVNTDDYPVEQVRWDDRDVDGNPTIGIQEFLKRLNAPGEGTFRLPTEAEWEYACRAGTTTEFSFGDDIATFDQYGWAMADITTEYTTHPVGQKKPNPWGLYDMHGNVIEWCQDWYGKDYYAASPPTNPPGPEPGTNRVRRGGGFHRDRFMCRSAYRSWNLPNFTDGNTGFRLCRNR